MIPVHRLVYMNCLLHSTVRQQWLQSLYKMIIMLLMKFFWHRWCDGVHLKQKPSLLHTFRWRKKQPIKPSDIEWKGSFSEYPMVIRTVANPSEETASSGSEHERSSVVVISKSGTCFWGSVAVWITTSYCYCTRCCSFWRHWSPSCMHTAIPSSVAESSRVMFAWSVWNVLCIFALQKERTDTLQLNRLFMLHLTSILAVITYNGSIIVTVVQWRQMESRSVHIYRLHMESSWIFMK